MSRYRVTAPLVIAHDQQGSAHHRYEGSLIPWLSDVQRERLLEAKMVEEIPDATPPGVAAPDDDSDDTGQPDATTAAATPAAPQSDSPVQRPPQVATKEAWVDYAVNGLGMDRAAAEAMTKADLIARAG